MACTNDIAAKTREVLDQLGPAPSADLLELLRRGAFRHSEDVAYAVIMLDRGATVESLVADSAEAYALLEAHGHRCDPVLPG